MASISFSLRAVCAGMVADGFRLSGSRTYAFSHSVSRRCPTKERSGPTEPPSPRILWHEAQSFCPSVSFLRYRSQQPGRIGRDSFDGTEIRPRFLPPELRGRREQGREHRHANQRRTEHSQPPDEPGKQAPAANGRLRGVVCGQGGAGFGVGGAGGRAPPSRRSHRRRATGRSSVRRCSVPEQVCNGC
jgi:hypothetical protein